MKSIVKIAKGTSKQSDTFQELMATGESQFTSRQFHIINYGKENRNHITFTPQKIITKMA